MRWQRANSCAAAARIHPPLKCPNGAADKSHADRLGHSDDGRPAQVIDVYGESAGDCLHIVELKAMLAHRISQFNWDWPPEGPGSQHHQREVGMTPTYAAAASTPREAGPAPTRKGSSMAWRRLLVVPVALLIAVALLAPASALATEPTSGYSQTVPTPPTTPTTPTTPSTGTTPSTTPSSGTSPSTSTGETKAPSPTSETSPSSSSKPAAATSPSTSAKASTLPFTGLDLRWTIAIGLLLIAAGASIVVMQRRQRRSTGR